MTARHRGASTDTRADLDAEGPLRRWARRKREVARENAEADEDRRGDESAGPSQAAPGADGSTADASAPNVVEEQVPTDEDMPPLDSLDENSDYSGFLSPGVSEALRRRALRKLFSSAVFNIPDGLDDYDDDFTTFEALGDIVTSDMRHQAEAEAERARQARTDSDPAAEPEVESEEVEERQVAHADDAETDSKSEESAGRPDFASAPALEDPGASLTDGKDAAAEHADAAGNPNSAAGRTRGSDSANGDSAGSVAQEGRRVAPLHVGKNDEEGMSTGFATPSRHGTPDSVTDSRVSESAAPTTDPDLDDTDHERA